MERFTQLSPNLAQIKPVTDEGEIIYWEAYDKSGSLIGYTFTVDAPEAAADIEETGEMDKYQVLGLIDPEEYKIIALDISLHPEGPEEPWAEGITEPEFKSQYIGLTVEEIDLFPDGKIDAITDATMSSTWVTDAIRGKIEEIIDRTATP